MIIKRCKYCESYHNKSCIGSEDTCFNLIEYPKIMDGEYSCENCNYGDFCK